MEINATLVKDLREATGLGMMICKKALIEANGDMEKAIDNLRKQGQATAAKRAGRSAKEGRVSIVINGNDALVYEVNSETDFVARNEDFNDFVVKLAPILLAKKPENIESAKQLTDASLGGQSIEAKILELIAKIGENITFRRFHLCSIDPSTQRIFSYTHGNGKIGVLGIISADKTGVVQNESVAQLGKDIAMQIAASTPIAIDRHAIAADVLAKEKEIYLTQAQSSGKPENIWDKIVEGKLSKFYKDVCLIEQIYIKDTEISVTDRIRQVEKEIQAKITVVSFVRFELGAGE